MKKAAYDMLYLCACAVNGTRPEEGRLAEMEMDKLYKTSKRHSLEALCAMALASAGTELPKEWRGEKDRAVRKSILFDAERAQILRFMEEKGIWYMPLKGVIIKDMYPKLGMRQMADNDILYDKNHQQELMEFMKARGYDVLCVGKGAHDTYHKDPIYNFEMHTKLFAESKEKFFLYYKNVKERLLPVEGKKFEYRFSDEDYYVYITAHEYKHYSGGGTGLRSLLDKYVYVSGKKELDIAYIESECKKLGIAEFERESRALSLRVFSGTELPELSKNEEEMLLEYLFSGTYGTLEKLYKNKLCEAGGGKADGKAKLRYIWQRIFPPMDFYKDFFPTAYKYKILIPFIWFRRILRAVFVRRKDVKKELDVIKKVK